ncbi:H/ACA ribonucleoprotein complex subunit 3 [Trachymyrmex cornetzi]|uniref:Nucleolar protein 10 n=1 Tax=Trachymyrmex cornetzi TaxID=471704 RepID=A0A195D7P4_9HYME|nr:H/ACA ribonucleoprotein complex subunit 3 [Trachymyrmex cornetzi]
MSAHPGKFLHFCYIDTLCKIKKKTKGTILNVFSARFSVEDKYSRERITMKRRFGLLLTQQPQPNY